MVARAVQLLDDKNCCIGRMARSGSVPPISVMRKDRVVQRENGLYTYFASDIAYHLSKYERGFDYLLNIWGRTTMVIFHG